MLPGDGRKDGIHEHDCPQSILQAMTDRRQERSGTRVPNNYEIRTAGRRLNGGVDEIAPLGPCGSTTPVRFGRTTPNPRARATSSSGLQDDDPTNGLCTRTSVDETTSRLYVHLPRCITNPDIHHGRRRPAAASRPNRCAAYSQSEDEHGRLRCQPRSSSRRSSFAVR